MSSCGMIRVMVCSLILALSCASGKGIKKGDAPKSSIKISREFGVYVTTQDADLLNNQSGLDSNAVDTNPVLTIDDIKYLRYNPSTNVEYAFEINPETYAALKNKLSKLYMKRFLLVVNSEILYTGIFVSADFAIDHLVKAQYAGTVIVLPPQMYIPEKCERIIISYIAEEGIYVRADDPRGNKELINYFKEKKKLQF